MKTEIETRFLEIDVPALTQQLTELGAVDRGEIMLNDIIFYDPELLWQSLGKFVRLRKKGDVVTLTYKHTSSHTIDGTQEVEFAVSDMHAARAFVEAIGLAAYRTVEKKRHTFTLDAVSVDIDSWPKIPPYVELEGDSIEEVRAVAEKLGFAWENRFDASPGQVFKKYGYDINTIQWITFDRFG